MAIKPPLKIYIICHQQSENDNEAILKALYSVFARNITTPLSRHIGVPVFFRVGSGLNVPMPINVDESERTIVISLIDNHSVIDSDFIQYQNDIFKSTEQNNANLFIPVAITPNAFNIESDFSELNMIRLFELGIESDYIKLKTSLLHEVCRHLYSKTRDGLSPEPLQVFISHAKRDGSELAVKVKKYFADLTSAKTFFDVTDITVGHSFVSEIVNNIKKSVLLVNYTDAYSSREWCRREILAGKQAKIPILIINSLKKFEYRSFPYCGNLPVVTWYSESNDEQEMLNNVAFELMFESLRYEYNQFKMDYLIGLYGLNVAKENVLSSPPELLSITHIEKNEKLVIYPDPPLSNEEIELLESLSNSHEYITPVMFPLKSTL